jgi:hypothetical protein
MVFNTVDHRDVRPTQILKNPFNFNPEVEEARALTPNRSFIDSNIKRRGTPNQYTSGNVRFDYKEGTSNFLEENLFSTLNS